MGKFTDESIMPFGRYQGKKMEDVPASYLIWMWDEGNKINDSRVREYVLENLDVLRKQVEETKNKNNVRRNGIRS